MLTIPVSHDIFMARYFEQEPLLCASAVNELAMGWSDLDNILQTVDPDPTVVQLFLDGQVDPANYLTESIELGRPRRRLNKHRFYDLMQHGATLVLNRTEEYCVAAKRLSGAIGQFARQPTTSNAYFSCGGSEQKTPNNGPANSPKAAGSFGKHWDTHDVFAIQLVGKKLWQLYAPTQPLPLSHQTSRRMQQSCPALPTFECVLEAGDLLYIPRGWWHQVTPLDCASLHLSVGTYPQTISDYIMWVCSHQLPQLFDARKTCRDDPSLSASLDSVMQSLNQAIFNGQHVRDFLRQQHLQERLNSEFNTELFLDNSAGNSVATFSDAARLSLSSVYPVAAEVQEIAVNGGRLKLSPASRAVIQTLQAQSAMTWKKLAQTLPQIAPPLLQEAVLDLARYEVINIVCDNK